MQVPERLALIGGSILLASTLVFTLKSQASHILPKISDGIGAVYQDLTDTQAEHGGLSFNDAYQNAEHHGWKTGTWGSSRYYIDKDNNMHIGSGKLDGALYDVVGDDYAHKISTISLDENVQAPQDSSNLFAGRNYHKGFDADDNDSITEINGLDKLDVSQTTNTVNMFYRDWKLSSPMNINDWDMSNVQSTNGMFGNTNIPSFDIKDWNVSNVNSIGWMFYNDYAVHSLDLSGWRMNGLNVGNDAFAGDKNLSDLNLQNFRTGSVDGTQLLGNTSSFNDYNGPSYNLNRITLGKDTQFKLSNIQYFPDGNWKNGDQTISSQQLIDGNAHPGTWVKQ